MWHKAKWMVRPMRLELTRVEGKYKNQDLALMLFLYALDESKNISVGKSKPVLFKLQWFFL